MRIAVQLMAFAVVYVLSIGPLFWQWYAAWNANGSYFFAAFYEPLRVACEKSETVRNAVNWYINLWIS